VHLLDFNKRILILKMHGANIKIKLLVTTAELLGAAFYCGLQQQPSKSFHVGKKSF
jgi:hypothetical protein